MSFRRATPAAERVRLMRRVADGVTYANRAQGATAGACPGYQPFGGWKGSGSTGKAIASLLLPRSIYARTIPNLVE